MTAARIFHLHALHNPLQAWDWPFAREQTERIDAHWHALQKANPMLYNGRILLRRVFAPPSETGGLNGFFFETDYKTFLAWRDFGLPDTSVANCFAMAALRSRDGAYVLGEMGSHTSCAGQVYFPAGIPDRNDIRGAHVDLDASLARELLEETGVSIDETEADTHWTIVHMGSRIACIRILNVSQTAQDLHNDLRTRLSRQEKPELACFHLIRSLSECDALPTPDFIRAFFAHLDFSEAP